VSVQVNLFKLALITFVAVSLVVFGDTGFVGRGSIASQNIAVIGWVHRGFDWHRHAVLQADCLVAGAFPAPHLARCRASGKAPCVEADMALTSVTMCVRRSWVLRRSWF
jgi:hypothetical protein